MSTVCQDNYQVYESLKWLVADQFLLGDNISQAKITYGPMEINDFSVCFWVNVNCDSGHKGLYVKIPKTSIIERKVAKRTIMPLSDNDRIFAQDEYRSLVHLSKIWKSDDIKVGFVKPLKFFKEYNAIVTGRISAGHIFRLFRKQDVKKKLHINKNNDLVHDALLRIGMALSRFHQRSFMKGVFTSDKAVLKMERYCLELRSFGTDLKFNKWLLNKVRALKGYVTSTQMTQTLKGLDLRNVFINEDGTLFLVDPGRMKEDYQEADLARFMITCRILYWGGMLFFFRVTPHRSYEESFIQGYYGFKKRSNKLLDILVIKELLKQWRWAYVNIEFKHWPEFLKYILKKTYVDPFYKREIAAEFSSFGK
jgi:hypothetical protein